MADPSEQLEPGVAETAVTPSATVVTPTLSLPHRGGGDVAEGARSVADAGEEAAEAAGTDAAPASHTEHEPEAVTPPLSAVSQPAAALRPRSGSQWGRLGRLAVVGVGALLAGVTLVGQWSLPRTLNLPTAGQAMDFQERLSDKAPRFDSTDGGFLARPERRGAPMSSVRIAEQAEQVTVMIIADEGGGQGYGSGVILRSDGYVLTNRHVVDAARSLRVALFDGTKLDAKLVWTSQKHDLALLSVPAQKLSAATLGDSSSLARGEELLAVGYPLGSRIGSRPSITRGIVSQIQRLSDGTFIQTDAAVNPGNSGGPLFNSSGQVVGITTKRAENSGGRAVYGISWALPINVARSVIPSLEALAEH